MQMHGWHKQVMPRILREENARRTSFCVVKPGNFVFVMTDLVAPKKQNNKARSSVLPNISKKLALIVARHMMTFWLLILSFSVPCVSRTSRVVLVFPKKKWKENSVTFNCHLVLLCWHTFLLVNIAAGMNIYLFSLIFHSHLFHFELI